MRKKNATRAKIPPERTRLAGDVRADVTVGSGRQWNEGRGASQIRGCCSGSRAPVYEPRVGRWFLQAFGYVFDLGHQCTRSRLSDWPDCMGHKLGECHHISMSGSEKVSVGSERMG